jgi:hypothetical protein
MMSISGGKFWNGFAAGAASSIASSLFSFDGNSSNDGTLGWGNSVRSSGAGMIAFGTVSGGAGAHLSGGNFWQGAVTGLVVSGLNHYAHQTDDNDDIIRINTKDKTATVETTGDNYDRIFVDGKEVMATPRGALGPDLRGAGYDISMKGPQGVGMGLTDLALEVFGAKGLGLFTRATVSSSYGAKLFESKLLGYASKNFGRYHSKFVPNGVKGVLNNGFIRTGWSNNGATHTFRTAIGHNPNQLMKIDWFLKP